MGIREIRCKLKLFILVKDFKMKINHNLTIFHINGSSATIH